MCLISCFWNAARATFPLLLSLIVISFFNFRTVAQPGDEAYYLERAAAQVARFDAQILKSPNDPNLYFERGRIYLDWYSRYGNKVEHRGAVYATDPGAKALADIERAIQLQPRGPFFVLLGNYHQAVFSRKDHALGEITDATSWQEIKRRYWDDELIGVVLKSFQTALEIAGDAREKGHALAHLGAFYNLRASRMSSGAPAKIVVSNKQTQVVYDDYDKAIDLKQREIVSDRPNLGGLPALVNLYRSKAVAAVDFNDLAAGIRALSEGIKVVTDLDELRENVCDLYVRRGELHTMRKDLAAALHDYSYSIDSKMVNCLDVYEKRGDIYTQLGDWSKAVSDYTREMTLFQHRVPRLHAKRGNAYLRVGDGENAVVDLDQALEFSTCGPLFRLRAEALRLLNKAVLAAEDEQKAAKYSIGRSKDQCAFR